MFHMMERWPFGILILRSNASVVSSSCLFVRWRFLAHKFCGCAQKLSPAPWQFEMCNLAGTRHLSVTLTNCKRSLLWCFYEYETRFMATSCNGASICTWLLQYLFRITSYHRCKDHDYFSISPNWLLRVLLGAIGASVLHRQFMFHVLMVELINLCNLCSKAHWSNFSIFWQDHSQEWRDDYSES
jgi:hypothetical protein